MFPKQKWTQHVNKEFYRRENMTKDINLKDLFHY